MTEEQKNNKIEEMTHDIYDAPMFAPTLWQTCKKIAEFLYNAGYRKQSESEWIEDVIAFCNVCSSCRAKVDRSAIKCNSGKLNYCPNCGAKMVEN